MQTTSNASLFQTSYSEALGAYRSRKAIHTSALVTPSTSSSTRSSATDDTADALRRRWGYPIQLNPRFEEAVIRSHADLAVQGAGADGGRYRVLSLQVIGRHAWSSESGGVVRQVELESGKTINVYRGAKAPVPAFDFITTDEGERLLVTGSWDRALRVYRVSERPNDKEATVPVVTVDNAMADFIKCVHTFSSSGKSYIATAGSEKSVMVWDASALISASFSAESKLRCVHQCKQHTRPVNALASLSGLDGTTYLYSADSMGRILESTLHPTTLRLEVRREIQGFATAVYDLKAGWTRLEVQGQPDAAQTHSTADAFVSAINEDQDGQWYKHVAELWGASGDKSVAGYRLSPLLQPESLRSAASGSGARPVLGTQRPVSVAAFKLVHPDFVKALVPLAFYLPAELDRFPEAVVTGGSDEHLRLYPHVVSHPELIYQVEAHWHEVTSLAVWIRTPAPASHPTSSVLPPLPPHACQVWIVSASLDGSIRRWNLTTIPTLPKPQLSPVNPDTHTIRNLTPAHWDQHSLPPTTTSEITAGENTPLGIQLSADEEAELAELMDSDNDT